MPTIPYAQWRSFGWYRFVRITKSAAASKAKLISPVMRVEISHRSGDRTYLLGVSWKDDWESKIRSLLK